MTDPMQALESFDGLDGVADWLSKTWRGLLNESPSLKHLLSGAPLGHPLHPVLSDVPIGTWTSALLLDLIGGRGSEDSADLLVLAGLLAAGPTALAGWSDWSDAQPSSKPIGRVGIVHATTNATAIALFGASLVARRSGDRSKGKRLGLVAGGVLATGGYLGGHLTYAQGARVETHPPAA
jgi:uncharacterized membrane protein